jgi:hypothetical protein
MTLKHFSLTIVVLITCSGFHKMREKRKTLQNSYSVAFYNLENLFDTINDTTGLMKEVLSSRMKANRKRSMAKI